MFLSCSYSYTIDRLECKGNLNTQSEHVIRTRFALQLNGAAESSGRPWAGQGTDIYAPA
jgi:hypothetical protein